MEASPNACGLAGLCTHTMRPTGTQRPYSLRATTSNSFAITASLSNLVLSIDGLCQCSYIHIIINLHTEVKVNDAREKGDSQSIVESEVSVESAKDSGLLSL